MSGGHDQREYDLAPPPAPPLPSSTTRGATPVLPYSEPRDVRERRIDALLSWRNKMSVGFGLQGAAFIAALGLRLSGPAWLPRLDLLFLGAVIVVGATGLFFGLKDNTWGLLAGASAAMLVLLALRLLLLSACGF